jgi:hypothetical protein
MAHPRCLDRIGTSTQTSTHSARSDWSSTRAFAHPARSDWVLDASRTNTSNIFLIYRRKKGRDEVAHPVVPPSGLAWHRLQNGHVTEGAADASPRWVGFSPATSSTGWRGAKGCLQRGSGVRRRRPSFRQHLGQAPEER